MLDGSLLYDDAICYAMAEDIGQYIHRRPIAVLRPGSTRDIAQILNYANRNRLKIAMRGRGHASFGQAQVDGGIVVDSSTLSTVEDVQSSYVDAQAGTLWGEVAKTTLAKGLTPPVMTHCPDILTVGGTLSVGGLSNTSHRFGAQVDHVMELQVVTGSGQMVTCSPQQNRELFEMMLGGLGQCGIIVRARLGLVPAPRTVALMRLEYDDFDSFLSDQILLVRENRFDHQGGAALPKPNRGWAYVIEVGKFITGPGDPGIRSMSDGLNFTSKSAIDELSYVDYLRRDSGHRMPGGNTPSPFVAFWLPPSKVKEFSASILTSELEMRRMWLFGFNVYHFDKFNCRLLRTPGTDLGFVLWIFHTAPSGDRDALRSMIALNRTLFEKIKQMGGNAYPAIRSFPFLPADWQDHFGDHIWHKLVEAKKKFDPNGVLTPGQRMFSTSI